MQYRVSGITQVYALIRYITGLAHLLHRQITSQTCAVLRCVCKWAEMGRRDGNLFDLPAFERPGRKNMAAHAKLVQM